MIPDWVGDLVVVAALMWMSYATGVFRTEVSEYRRRIAAILAEEERRK